MVWEIGDFIQDKTYQIEDILGGGDFGITYKATHLPSQETVVIKTPKEKLKDRQNYSWYVKRFLKESQLLAKVSETRHPHLVEFRDFFYEGERMCLVMEFIPGTSLYRWVRKYGPLPEQYAIICIRQIASAISAMHKVGVVHRDAHPGNMILRLNPSGNTESFETTLIDLGHAGEINCHAAVEAKILGNKFFAPYEQLYQRPGYQKPTVDVHALAGSLYYLLTQEYPPESYERRVNGVPLVPATSYNPNVSEQVNEAIIQGMAVMVSNRPQSVEEWLKLVPGG